MTMQNKADERSAKNNKLASAPLGKLMLELALPTVFAQLVNLLYNMVDRIYVGRIPETGTVALAGLGVCFPIILLVAAFSALIGQGGAPQAAIAMGQGNNKKAEQILGSATAFLIILSLSLSVLFLFTKDAILMMFGASDMTLPYADSYLSIYLLGTISVQISLGLNPFISCQGFAKTSMMTVLIGAVINIILDPIFIYGMHMGVAGAALATIISQSVSAIWVLVFLSGKKSLLRLRLSNMKPDFKILAPVLALGVSPFIMQSTECLVQLTFNTGMQRYGNDYYVGAMTILFSLSQMLFLPMQGLAQGATPIISFNYGAGNMDRVKHAFKIMFISCVSFAFVATGTIMLFPKVFISLFSTDPEIIRIGTYAVRIYVLGFLIFGAQSACQQTFVALNQAKVSMFIALLRKVILLIPLALILPKIGGLGVNGLFIAEPVSDIISVTTTVILFRITMKRVLGGESK